MILLGTVLSAGIPRFFKTCKLCSQIFNMIDQAISPNFKIFVFHAPSVYSLPVISRKLQRSRHYRARFSPRPFLVRPEGSRVEPPVCVCVVSEHDSGQTPLTLSCTSRCDMCGWLCVCCQCKCNVRWCNLLHISLSSHTIIIF